VGSTGADGSTADEALRAPLGELLGEGADARIHVVDARRVIRVAKDGRSLRHEAEIQRYAAASGFPVPAVLAVSDDGERLLIERIDGPSMLELLLIGALSPADAGAQLGALHQGLHAIEAPSWLRMAGPGTAFLHLDLHPANVLVADGTPVVIDWPNAASGPAALDVADAYLTMAALPVPDGDLARLQLELIAAFLASAGEPDAARWFPAVIERRANDPHFPPEWIERMRATAAQS
jgi:hypothetical protein